MVLSIGLQGRRAEAVAVVALLAPAQLALLALLLPIPLRKVMPVGHQDLELTRIVQAVEVVLEQSDQTGPQLALLAVLD